MPLDMKALLEEGRRRMWEQMSPEERRDLIATIPLDELLAYMVPEELEQLNQLLENKRD